MSYLGIGLQEVEWKVDTAAAYRTSFGEPFRIPVQIEYTKHTARRSEGVRHHRPFSGLKNIIFNLDFTDISWHS